MALKQGFIYRGIMKESRNLYKSIGFSFVLFIISMGLILEYIVTPLLGKAWSLVLMTTPDGFVSNDNVVNTLLRSPWIIPAGLLLIVLYAFFLIWQASAVVIGIAYLYQGDRIRIKDLILIPTQHLKGRVKIRNWMILVYALFIIPLSNIYQSQDMITVFLLPEYVEDFIFSKTMISILFILVSLLIVYASLRWFFLIPAIVLKSKDFKEARAESRSMTSGKWFKDGINIILYSLVEFVRLSLVPAILILLPVFICYLATGNLKYATNLYNFIGITIAMEIVKNITGTLVQISILCFLVQMYFSRLQGSMFEDEIILPQIVSAGERKLSITRLQMICSVFFSVLIAIAYIGIVFAAQTDSGIITELFGKTEIVAHKGYSSKAPENTMPAFKLADACEEVTYIELDVRSTKDGIPVVIHDASILSATGIDKEVYEITYEELQEIPAPYNMPAEKFPDARIPSLEDVIKTYEKSTPLLIEIKGYKEDPELPGKVVELMEKYNCTKTSLVQSGDYGALKAVKTINSNIKCGLILAMVTGDYYDLPYADFFSIEHTFIDQATVSTLQARGKGSLTWTVNYKESLDEIKFTGVNGIITDYPEEIGGYYANSNHLVDSIFHLDFDKTFNDEAERNAIQSYKNGEY